MALLTAGALTRDIDLVLFDKDGTLLDFNRLWGPRTAQAIAELALAAGRPDLVGVLRTTIGYDAKSGRIRPETPMAVASIATNALVAATVLHQGGVAWHAAELLVRAHFVPPLAATPAAGELGAIGDIAGLLARLSVAGLKLGIVTTDDRAGTTATAERLHWMPYLVGLSCGDDPWPAKPDPAALHVLCARAGVAPARTAMIGDSLGDIAVARAAGCGLAVAVRSGTGAEAELARVADVVVDDAHALSVG